ncbi:hypothetical protein HK100_011234, partial [Physocladia obscura]
MALTQNIARNNASITSNSTNRNSPTANTRSKYGEINEDDDGFMSAREDNGSLSDNSENSDHSDWSQSQQSFYSAILPAGASMSASLSPSVAIYHSDEAFNDSDNDNGDDENDTASFITARSATSRISRVSRRSASHRINNTNTNVNTSNIESKSTNSIKTSNSSSSGKSREFSSIISTLSSSISSGISKRVTLALPTRLSHSPITDTIVSAPGETAGRVSPSLLIFPLSSSSPDSASVQRSLPVIASDSDLPPVFPTRPVFTIVTPANNSISSSNSFQETKNLSSVQKQPEEVLNHLYSESSDSNNDHSEENSDDNEDDDDGSDNGSMATVTAISSSRFNTRNQSASPSLSSPARSLPSSQRPVPPRLHSSDRSVSGSSRNPSTIVSIGVGGAQQPINSSDSISSRSTVIQEHRRDAMTAAVDNSNSNNSSSSSQSRRLPVRLVSLDVFRGLVIIGMIIANFQVDGAWPIMMHPDWIGFSFADVVFPSFIFIMGAAIPISMKQRAPTASLPSSVAYSRQSIQKVLLRSLKLFGIGFLLNLPASFATFRVMGVLQRMGIIYAIVASSYLLIPSPRVFIYGLPSFLILLWTLITVLYMPAAGEQPYPDLPPCPARTALEFSYFSPAHCTAQSAIDSAVFGRNHTYMHLPFDNEGLLSTLTACVTCIAGCALGQSLQRATLSHDYSDGSWRRRLAARIAGAAAVSGAVGVGGFAGVFGVPVAKNLWTPSFVGACLFFSGSVYTAVFLWIDGIGNSNGGAGEINEQTYLLARSNGNSGRSSLAGWDLQEIKMLASCGQNPLALFVISTVFEKVLYMTGLGMWLFRNLFEWIQPLGLASLLWSFSWALFVFIPIGVYMNTRKCTLLPDEKTEIRTTLLSLVCDESPKLIRAYAETISKIAQIDYPHDWPEVIPSLLATIESTFNLASPLQQQLTANPQNFACLKRVNLSQQHAIYTLHRTIKAMYTVKTMRVRHVIYQIAPQLVQNLSLLFASNVSTFLTNFPTPPQAAAALTDVFVVEKLDGVIQIARLCLKILRRLIVNGFPERSDFVRVNNGQPKSGDGVVVAAPDFYKPFERVDACVKTLQIRQSITNLPALKPIWQAASKIALTIGKLYSDLISSRAINFVVCRGSMDVLRYYWSLIANGSSSGAPDANGNNDDFVERILLQALIIFRADRHPQTDYVIKLLSEQLLTPSFVTNAAQILVTKYMVMNNEELERWNDEPESFMADEEADQWEFSLRMCAQKALMDLISKNRTTIAPVLVSMLQQVSEISPSADSNSILMKDA